LYKSHIYNMLRAGEPEAQAAAGNSKACSG
jgi:hypothetical protein